MEEEELYSDLINLLNPQQNDDVKAMTTREPFDIKRIMQLHFETNYSQVVCDLFEKKQLKIFIPFNLFGVEKYRAIVILQINLQTLDKMMCIYLADQYGKIHVQQKMLKLQLGRYMLRQNNNLRDGSFFVNPIYGYIGFNVRIEQDKEQCLISEELCNKQYIPFLDSQIQIGMNIMRFQSLRIMFLMNQMKIKDFPLFQQFWKKQQRIFKWSELPKEAEELLSRIKLIVKRNMHLPFTDEQYKVYGTLLSQSVTTDQKCLVEIVPTQLIELENLQRKINEGGFCDIYQKDLKYSVVKEEQKSLYFRQLGAGLPPQKTLISFNKESDNTYQSEKQKRNLIIKKEKDQNGGRVEREREILLTLAADNKQMNSLGDQFIKKNGCCPYIAQFYFVKDKKDILLMEQYYCSLDYFKVKQQDVISLSTKIQIAHSIAMGLRYIHSYGIVHMDIKPANILISKNTLMAKITDFGEAINIQDKGNAKSGKTYPYAAPEMTQGKQITTAYDIFAFGTMLFELIFDRYPIDFKKTNNKNLEERFLKNNYYVRYDEVYAQTMGPQVIVKYLGRMCIQCLQPEPQNRPNIDKICLVLQDCKKYLDISY